MKRLSTLGLSKLLVRYGFCRQPFDALRVKQSNIKDVSFWVDEDNRDSRIVITCKDEKECKKLQSYLYDYHDVEPIEIITNVEGKAFVEVGVSYFRSQDKRFKKQRV